MKKTGVIYGSSTGTCEEIAKSIAAALGVDSSDVIDVSGVSVEQINGYEALLLGSSTWGLGELQDDWYDGVTKLKSADLSGKSVGFFGCGDADSYPDTFCDALGLIYNDIADKGINVVGKVSTDGYSFDASAAVIDGGFIGLVIDDMNESDQTADRIASWCEQLKGELA